MGRNYLFAVPDSPSYRQDARVNYGYVLDAITISNETRFPNHSKKEREINCIAKTKLVNGQSRIGLFATRAIKPMEELLFDYGDEFFQS